MKFLPSPACLDRRAFTLLELLVVISVIGILIGMMLPAVRSVREPARRTACSNNMRQIALAMLNFESAHGHFPAIMGEPQLLELSGAEDKYRLSGVLVLTPFIEGEDIWNQIKQPMVAEGVEYPPLPSPTDRSYPGWQPKVNSSVTQLFRCPSVTSGPEWYAETNYVFSIGDVAQNIHHPKKIRGTNAAGFNVKLSDIRDGTSHSILLSEVMTADDSLVKSKVVAVTSAEILQNPRLCFDVINKEDPRYLDESCKLVPLGRGGNWADGSAVSSMFNTILPPNSPSVAIDNDAPADGFYSASSNHAGGVNAARADGSVCFVSDDIDTGDLSAAPVNLDTTTGNTAIPSPYGVWGASGSIAGEEVDYQW